MKQTFTVNAKRTVIHNHEAPRSNRVDAGGDVLDRIPNPVELRRDRRLRTRSTVLQRHDVIDRPAPHVPDDIQQASTHLTPSSSMVAPSPEPTAVFTTPRVEEPVPFPSGTTAAAPTPHTGAAAPRLFYQDRLVTLYHGDSLLAPELWLHADVMITDPPYGLQALAGSYGSTTSANGSRTIANDLDTTVRDRALQLWGDKPAAVFGTPRLEEPPGGWTDRLVWDKAQLGLNGGPWRYAHETIFVRGDGWHRINDASSSILRHSTQGNRANVNKHIHSKPEKLLADLIAAAPRGILVDPFAGGGSTVAAACALGRHIIAFELDEQHCETIVDRVTSRIDLGFDGGGA